MVPPGLSGMAKRPCSVLMLQYSAWLDQHSTAEALKSIAAALQASTAEAKQADVVPTMLQLCQVT